MPFGMLSVQAKVKEQRAGTGQALLTIKRKLMESQREDEQLKDNQWKAKVPPEVSHQTCSSSVPEVVVIRDASCCNAYVIPHCSKVDRPAAHPEVDVGSPGINHCST